MTSDAILAELRALPGAPESLHERVRSLPEPQSRFEWTLPRLDLRRFLLVAAPAVVALAVGAAALHGVLAGGSNARPTAAVYGTLTVPQPAVQHREKSLNARAQRAAPPYAFAPNATGTALAPSSTRLNKYEAWLTVDVPRDRLSKATTHAMQIARGYGGYVASVDMNTPGKRGTSLLVLRVPVTKVEDAVLRLGKLGDVTASRFHIQDLQRQANVLQRQILALQTAIAKLEQKLASTSLSPADRLRLQYQLAETRRTLAQKTKTRAATVREGTLATVSLTFSTPQPAAAVPHHQGRLERTARDAGAFLVRELAWLLYALIVLAPIALLAGAAVFAVRSGRRRSEARLLGQP
jgi:uncharacterized protein DUF4349